MTSFGSIYIPPAARPYVDIIDEALTARDQDVTVDPVSGLPRFVQAMCERLLARIQVDRPETVLSEVLAADRLASGHADYHRRLARSCAEIGWRPSPSRESRIDEIMGTKVVDAIAETEVGDTPR